MQDDACTGSFLYHTLGVWIWPVVGMLATPPPMYLCSSLRAILPEEPDGGLKDGDPYGALPLRDRTEAPLAGARFVASKTCGSGITNDPATPTGCRTIKLDRGV